MMFERFPAHARRAVVWAQEEARMLNHDYIGTEHFLLGLIHETDGVAAQSLQTFGITLEDARSAVENTIGRGEHPAFGHIPFTPQPSTPWNRACAKRCSSTTTTSAPSTYCLASSPPVTAMARNCLPLLPNRAAMNYAGRYSIISPASHQNLRRAERKARRC